MRRRRLADIFRVWSSKSFVRISISLCLCVFLFFLKSSSQNYGLQNQHSQGGVSPGRGLLNTPSAALKSKDQTPLADDWLVGESREGFLDVEDILRDPRTTQDPFTSASDIMNTPNPEPFIQDVLKSSTDIQDVTDSSDVLQNVESSTGVLQNIESSTNIHEESTKAYNKLDKEIISSLNLDNHLIQAKDDTEDVNPIQDINNDGIIKTKSDDSDMIKDTTDKVINKQVIGDYKDSLSDLKENSELETFHDDEKSSKNEEIRHSNEENKEKDALIPSVNNELNKIPSEKSFNQFNKEDPTDLLIKSFKLTHGKTPPSKTELSKLQARVKSDLALRKSENNNPDFKHVMAYNQNFVAHLVKDVYVPGYKIENCQLCQHHQGSGSGTDSLRLPEGGTDRLRLAILVISAPGHLDQREAIRRGWGRHRSKPGISFAFLVGTPENQQQIEALIQENSRHNDLVMTNIGDVYENLSLKILSGLNWFQTCCKEVDYLFKVDDDMFVQVDKLISMLEKKDKNSRLILGNISRGWKPVRNPKSKYYITQEQYDRELYPDFATGPSYIISGNVVSDLFNSAMDEKYLHLEDVFVTGILGELNNVTKVNVPEFRNNANRIPVRFMGCTMENTITIHKVLPEEQEEFENLAQNPSCHRRRGTHPNFKKNSQDIENKP